MTRTANTNNATVNAVQAAMAAVAAPVLVTVNPAHATVNTVAQKKEVATMKKTNMTKAQMRKALEEKNVTMSDSKFKNTKLADLQAMLVELEEQPVLTAESSDDPIDKVDVETLTTQQRKPIGKPVGLSVNVKDRKETKCAIRKFVSGLHKLMLNRGSKDDKLGADYLKVKAMCHAFIGAKVSAVGKTAVFPDEYTDYVVGTYVKGANKFATCVFSANGGNTLFALGIVYTVTNNGYYKPVSYNYICK